MTLRHTEAMQALAPGDPHHLGAHPVAGGVQFAVWAPEAEAVWLCLFDDSGHHELQRLPVPHVHLGIWHATVPGVGPGQVYGWRVAGPWQPAQGLRFNPQRVLLDPYAHAVVGCYAGDLDRYLDFDPADPRRPHPQDNGDIALKARVQAPARAPVVDVPPVPLGHRVVAEVHVRSATALHPEVPEVLRGTYAGLAHPALIAHWRQLGVTTLELMPVQARADEARLQRLGLPNHWGYTPIGFMAPEPRYASGQGGLSPAEELRQAIATLRRAGFEVVLDMVFNHSAETDLQGPCLSLKGLANRHWYRHDPKQPGAYLDWSGCGNTLNLGEPMVLRMVIDALRHWVQSYGVDGFRFDLAPALGRDDQGRYSPGAAFFAAWQTDPVLRRCLMIAEPWDLGPEGYQLGHFPVGWFEWNDQARDGWRAYWLHPEDRRADRAELANRLAGSSDRFRHDPKRPRRPAASLNFITAHDGFTLRDLLSYNQRHNLANGEGNRDGHHENLSWNCGTEGPSHDPAVLALRGRLQRALLATLLLSRGTPMLLMGDELGHSQQGNNNAYCQDSALTWLDWTAPDSRSLAAYIARLTQLRRCDTALRGDLWLHGRPGPDGLPDVRWLRPDGAPLAAADWHDRQDRALMVQLAPPGADHETLLLFNPAGSDRLFTLPPLSRGPAWIGRLDSHHALGLPAEGLHRPGPFMAPAHSVQLLCSHALTETTAHGGPT